MSDPMRTDAACLRLVVLVNGLPAAGKITAPGSCGPQAGAPAVQAGLALAGEGHAPPIMTSMTRDDFAGSVRLRAFTEDDLPFLDRLCTDPDVLGEFEWPGFTDPRARRRLPARRHL